MNYVVLFTWSPDSENQWQRHPEKIAQLIGSCMYTPTNQPFNITERALCACINIINKVPFSCYSIILLLFLLLFIVEFSHQCTSIVFANLLFLFDCRIKALWFSVAHLNGPLNLVVQNLHSVFHYFCFILIKLI